MSRKETSNTWSDGLMMDLHPINTPNTVLTDNLNGTMITYNGNEYLLQNDMGNHKLENCRLSENFVPVGLKEHGDILYIVSYNPITDETEIGSYPSPKVVNSIKWSDSLSDSNTFAIVNTINTLKRNEFTYNELDQYNYSYLFAQDNHKLNPGDYYNLTRNGYDTLPRYETVDYEIIDENKKSHDITEPVLKDIVKNGTKVVSWDVPGWLGYKSRVGDFDGFSLAITKFAKHENLISIGYRFQWRIDDSIFINDFDNLQRDLGVVLKSSFGNSIADVKDLRRDDIRITSGEIEWYNNNKIIYWEFEDQIALSDTQTSGNVVIEASPYVKVEDYKIDGRSYSYKINYSHLDERMEAHFDSFQSLNSNQVVVGDKKFKFNVTEGSFRLFFDVREKKEYKDSVLLPDEDTVVYYKLFDLQGNSVSNLEELDLEYDLIIDDYEDSDSSDNIGVINFNDKFEIENAYQIILFIGNKGLSNKDATLSSTLTTLRKGGELNIKQSVIITSTAFNFIEENISTDVSMDTWVNKYLEFINCSISHSDFSKTSKSDIKHKQLTNSNNYWSSKDGFLTETLTTQDVISYKEYELKFTINNTLDSLLKKYRVGLWKNILPEKVSYDVSGLYDSSGNTSSKTVTGGSATLTSYCFDKSKVSFNNNGSKKYSPDYSKRDIKCASYKVSIQYDKNRDDKNDADLERWDVYNSSTGKQVATWYISYGDKKISKGNPLSLLYNQISYYDFLAVEIKVGISDDGDGDDWTGFYGGTTAFWPHEDHSKTESCTKYFLVSRYKSESQCICIDDDYSSCEDITTKLSNLQLVTGSNVKEYNLYTGNIDSIASNNSFAITIIPKITLSSWKPKFEYNCLKQISDFIIPTFNSYSFEESGTDVDNSYWINTNEAILTKQNAIVNEISGFNANFTGIMGSSDLISSLNQNCLFDGYAKWNANSTVNTYLSSSDSGDRVNCVIAKYTTL